MRQFWIVPEKEGKGRSFTGYLMGSVIADGLWSGGEAATDVVRPVFAVIFASESEANPLLANLRMGKKALFTDPTSYHRRGGGEKMEFLKSAKFSVLRQRTPDGVAFTLYLHELFVMDPGMVDPEGIKFVLALPREQMRQDPWDRAGALEYLQKIPGGTRPEMLAVLDLAPSFAVYLDRRSRMAWPMDTRFYAHLLHSCLEHGLASLALEHQHAWNLPWGAHKSHAMQGIGLDSLMLTPAVSFKASHEDFATLLAKVTMDYFDLTGVRFDSPPVGT